MCDNPLLLCDPMHYSFVILSYASSFRVVLSILQSAFVALSTRRDASPKWGSVVQCVSRLLFECCLSDRIGRCDRVG